MPMRNYTLLNDSWSFTYHDGSVTTVNVPHTWNNIDGQDGGNDYWRGTCSYRKSFSAPAFDKENEVVYLEFRGVNASAKVVLNGKEVAVATVTAEDAWSFKFTNLPKFEAGKEIVYTVTEDAVAGYSVEYSDKNFDITNKYTPGKTSITVTKRWIDGNNHDSIRPSSVTIYLYAGDVKVAELKLTAKDNWTGVFDNLHIYENGKAIEYSISEKSVRGYNATFTGSAQHGFTVTNTHNIIPKTGDESNLPMYVSMFGASVCALAVLMFLAKSKKKGKNAR